MKVWVVGVGPGDPDLVHPQAQDVIKSADVVAGFTTVLNVVQPWIRGDVLGLTYRNQTEQLARFAERVKSGAVGVACAWGDPNVSNREMQEQIIQALGGHVPTAIPGISSVQVALARLGIALEEVLVMTLHTRAPVEQAVLEGAAMLRSGSRRVLSLIRPYEIMPNHLARLWLEAEVPAETPATVLERLSLPDERISSWTLGDLADSERKFSDLSIVVAGPGVSR